MPPAARDELTRALQAAQSGDSQTAEQLLPLIYDELRRSAELQLARCEPGQTLQATALVHEAWLRVADEESEWDSRAHFFGAAAQAMRQILVDQARHRAVRRNEVAARAKEAEYGLTDDSPVDDILVLHDALDRLEACDPVMARIVSLRFFGGVTMPEIARMVGEPLRTVERLWGRARSWLERDVRGASGT